PPHLGRSKQHRLAVAVERLLNERLQSSPELAPRPRRLQEKIVCAIRENPLEAARPVGAELGYQVAIFKQFRGEEEASRVDVALPAFTKPPTHIGAVIRRPEKTAAQTLVFEPIQRRHRPDRGILNGYSPSQWRNQGHGR